MIVYLNEYIFCGNERMYLSTSLKSILEDFDRDKDTENYKIEMVNITNEYLLKQIENNSVYAGSKENILRML